MLQFTPRRAVSTFTVSSVEPDYSALTLADLPEIWKRAAYLGERRSMLALHDLFYRGSAPIPADGFLSVAWAVAAFRATPHQSRDLLTSVLSNLPSYCAPTGVPIVNDAPWPHPMRATLRRMIRHIPEVRAYSSWHAVYVRNLAVDFPKSPYGFVTIQVPTHNAVRRRWEQLVDLIEDVPASIERDDLRGLKVRSRCLSNEAQIVPAPHGRSLCRFSALDGSTTTKMPGGGFQLSLRPRPPVDALIDEIPDDIPGEVATVEKIPDEDLPF